ncbi:MAG: hypothetical protein WBE74_07050 [Terracidiphilus sp.]
MNIAERKGDWFLANNEPYLVSKSGLLAGKQNTRRVSSISALLAGINKIDITPHGKSTSSAVPLH